MGDICGGGDPSHMPIITLPTLPEHEGDGIAVSLGEELDLENIWVDLVSEREELPGETRPQLYLI